MEPITLNSIPVSVQRQARAAYSAVPVFSERKPPPASSPVIQEEPAASRPVPQPVARKAAETQAMLTAAQNTAKRMQGANTYAQYIQQIRTNRFRTRFDLLL